MKSRCAQLTPIAIKRLKSQEETTERGTGIEITWADQSKTVLPSQYLREHCPCATCLEKRGEATHAKPMDQQSPSPGGRLSLKVIEADIETETNLKEVWLVGNYAIGMRWGDRHDSGIFSYEYLRSMDLELNGEKKTSSCDGRGGCKSDHHHGHHHHEHSGHRCKQEGGCSREGK